MLADCQGKERWKKVRPKGYISFTGWSLLDVISSGQSSTSAIGGSVEGWQMVVDDWMKSHFQWKRLVQDRPFFIVFPLGEILDCLVSIRKWCWITNSMNYQPTVFLLSCVCGLIFSLGICNLMAGIHFFKRKYTNWSVCLLKIGKFYSLI